MTATPFPPTGSHKFSFVRTQYACISFWPQLWVWWCLVPRSAVYSELSSLVAMNNFPAWSSIASPVGEISQAMVCPTRCYRICSATIRDGINQNAIVVSPEAYNLSSLSLKTNPNQDLPFQSHRWYDPRLHLTIRSSACLRRYGWWPCICPGWHHKVHREISQGVDVPGTVSDQPLGNITLCDDNTSCRESRCAWLLRGLLQESREQPRAMVSTVTSCFMSGSLCPTS